MKWAKKSVSSPLGMYIHIPFCVSKCLYCDFYSLPHAEFQMDRYAAALDRHLRDTASQCGGNHLDTIYFGGGTPSYFGGKRLAALLKSIRRLYRVDAQAEISLEANPDSAWDWRELQYIRRAGFNRISLGVQSWNNQELKRVGRAHTVGQAEDAVAAARKAGFRNLSLDLIYGLPGQTMDTWKASLEKAASLEPEHLSGYGLKVEEGTPLFQRQKFMDMPDDDLQADMYLYMVDYLAQRGWQQYEISNFARPGFASRHNLKYWRLEEYIGFGPGAHSDVGGVRYAYDRNLDEYCRRVEESGTPPLSESEEIPPPCRDMEYLMLGLRTTQGISREEFDRRYRLPFAPIAAALEPYCANGYAVTENGWWRLTPKGFLVSNRIIAATLDALGAEKIRREEAFAQYDFRIFQTDK